MIIKEFKYAPFSLQLNKPLVSSRNSTIQRRGFILKLVDHLNNSGYGEVSPLHPFSNETLENVEKELENLAGGIPGFSIKQDYFLNPETDFLYLNSPSVKFGFETALFDLMLQAGERDIKEILGFQINPEIKTNAMIGLLNSESVIEQTRMYMKEGFTTIKLKIGRPQFEEDLDLIDNLKLKFGDKINLRLDVNGKWSLQEAEEYLLKFKGYNIEYIEQPVNSVDELQIVSYNTKIPIAVDESIKTYNDFKILNEESRIKFFVIKPSIVGGIRQTLRMIKEASANGKFVIISSLFESNIGTDTLILLASVLNHKFAHGLGIHDYFDQNIDVSSYKRVRGEIVPAALQHKSIRNLDFFFKL